MAWSPEISQLSTDVTQLTTTVNVKKNQLSGAVTSAQSSKITANTNAVVAESNVAAATTNMLAANTHKNSVLSIYGTQALQQASLNIAAGQAGVAAASAVTATAGLTQDLSGINTAALHRSPYTITSMFVYDTSKDSDGGAWTEKCQHTSWYNETISGKWLGSQPNENSARVGNATLGPELFPNGSFTDTNNLVFTPAANCTLSIVNGRLRITRTAVGYGGAGVTLTGLTTGKLYRVQLDSINGSLTAIHRVRKDTFSAAYYGDNQYVGNTFVSQGTTLLVELGPAENSASGFCEYDNISVREVITVNSVSSDYFQLTADGKFYRLWKNLLRWSEDFSNAAWEKGNITVSPTQFAAPDGTTTADLIYPTTSGTGRNVNQPVTSGIAGENHTYTVYLKASGITKAYVYTMQGNGAVYFDLDPNSVLANSILSTPTVGAGSGFISASIRDAGNGWRACTVVSALTISGTRHCYTGPCDANASTTVTANGANGILIWGTQLEAGSVATTYEAKVANGTTSEVTRGNKRDFPRLAGIVCQSTGSNASQVAIYDLTEPGRPMWMAFVDYSLRSTVTKLLDWNSDDTGWSHVAMMNGWLIGTSNTSAGMCHFIKDWIAGVNGVEFSKNRVSDRNDVGTVTSTGRLTFTAAQSNSSRTVRMLVEPNAPVEPDTGLQRPSVLIGSTQPTYNSPTGVSFFYHTTANYDDVVFFPKLIAARRGFNSFSPNFFYTINPGLSSAISGEITATSAPDFALGGNTTKLIGATNGEFLRAPAASLVQKLKLNRSAVTKSLTATIRDTFNTGWMPGDIRRAYLSDTDVGSSGPATQIVTNSEFTDGVAGWTVTNPTSVSITVNAGVVAFDQIAYPLASMFQAITVFPGRRYTINARTGSVGGNYFHTIRVGNTSTSSEYYARQTTTGLTIHGGDFIPTQSTIYVSMTTDSGTNDIAYLDYIRVYETTIKDRSYKAIECNTNGLITKAQLAAGTSLVGYSGFSATNYLQEPYSADLDFGTGEFSASAWVNIPTTLPDSSFPVISSELISGNPTLTTGATFSAGAVTITGTVGSSGSWLLSGHTAGKVYRVIFNVLEVQSSGSPINIRVGVAGNEGLYNVIGIGTTGIKTVYFVATSGNAPKVTFSRSDTGVGQTRIGSISTVEVGPAIIFDRATSSGSRLRSGITGTGFLIAEAFDGTTTRTVTTTTAYNNAQWLKAEVNYTTDGSLAIRVNGREVAVTRGNPLLSLNSRRNLLTYTEAFNTLWYTARLTISPDTLIAPDGMLSADAIFETAAIGIHETALNQATSITAGSPYTASIYAKANGRSRFRIVFDLSRFAANQVFFDLSTGVADNIIGGTASMVPLPNGWYRCTFTMTATTTSSGAYPFYLAFVDTAVNTGYLGDVTKGLYLWGAQFEFGTAATTYQRIAATPETNVAPLTIGNNFTVNAPFPGSIALLKLGATAPTPEQSVFMYEQEKQLFRPGAISILPDANAIIDMSYDDATDRWVTVSTTNESYWNGLVRSSVTPVPAGSYSKITTTSGVELVSRTTTNPSVDVSIPPYALREELVKRSETASKLTRKTVTYDYTGGFTGNIAIGSTSILSVAGLVYPASYIGARISGTGIPANTTITGVSGTTIYISAPATATTNTLAITFLDFNLPIGMEAKVVLTAGVIKREGSTSDYTRLFDGFIETIRFAVAPGSTAWVQIQATRTTQ